MERHSGNSESVGSNPSSTMRTINKKLTIYSISKKDLLGKKKVLYCSLICGAIGATRPFRDKEEVKSSCRGEEKLRGGAVKTGVLAAPLPSPATHRGCESASYRASQIPVSVINFDNHMWGRHVTLIVRPQSPHLHNEHLNRNNVRRKWYKYIRAPGP